MICGRHDIDIDLSRIRFSVPLLELFLFCHRMETFGKVEGCLGAGAQDPAAKMNFPSKVPIHEED